MTTPHDPAILRMLANEPLWEEEARHVERVAKAIVGTFLVRGEPRVRVLSLDEVGVAGLKELHRKRKPRERRPQLVLQFFGHHRSGMAVERYMVR